MGALEEGDGILARNDAELILVGLLEEVREGAFLFGAEVERGLRLFCVAVSVSMLSGAIVLHGMV